MTTQEIKPSFQMGEEPPAIVTLIEWMREKRDALWAESEPNSQVAGNSINNCISKAEYLLSAYEIPQQLLTDKSNDNG